MIAFPGIHGNAASNAVDRWRQHRLFYDGDIFTHTKKMNLSFLYSCPPSKSSTRPVAPITHSPSIRTALVCQYPGVIKVSAPLARRHQEETCEFIDLHLHQMADNLIMRYITERWMEEGKPLKTVPGLLQSIWEKKLWKKNIFF